MHPVGKSIVGKAIGEGLVLATDRIQAEGSLLGIGVGAVMGLSTEGLVIEKALVDIVSRDGHHW